MWVGGGCGSCGDWTGSLLGRRSWKGGDEGAGLDATVREMGGGGGGIVDRGGAGGGGRGGPKVLWRSVAEGGVGMGLYLSWRMAWCSSVVELMHCFSLFFYPLLLAEEAGVDCGWIGESWMAVIRGM